MSHCLPVFLVTVNSSQPVIDRSIRMDCLTLMRVAEHAECSTFMGVAKHAEGLTFMGVAKHRHAYWASGSWEHVRFFGKSAESHHRPLGSSFRCALSSVCVQWPHVVGRESINRPGYRGDAGIPWRVSPQLGARGLVSCRGGGTRVPLRVPP